MCTLITFWGMFILLCKGKGDCWDCRNYCDITWFSMPSRLFTHILLKRIHKGTKGQNNLDSVTVERRREFGCGLLTAYTDFKKAIDSTHCESLWEILRRRRILTRIIALIACLYTGNASAAVWWGPIEQIWSEARILFNTHGLVNGQNYFPKLLWSP